MLKVLIKDHRNIWGVWYFIRTIINVCHNIYDLLHLWYFRNSIMGIYPYIIIFQHFNFVDALLLIDSLSSQQHVKAPNIKSSQILFIGMEYYIEHLYMLYKILKSTLVYGNFVYLFINRLFMTKSRCFKVMCDKEIMYKVSH